VVGSPSQTDIGYQLARLSGINLSAP